MGSRRALLMGVCGYQDRSIPDLPFVAGDLSKVGESLKGQGYTVSVPENPEPGRNEIIVSVERFLRGAQRSDSLLIYLSGHGAHSEGVDYLVPADAWLSTTDFADSCVRIGKWDADIQRTRAADVVFFIDACREGFDRRVQGTHALGWSSSELAGAARRKVAFVFSCSPGQTSAYLTSGTESFSAFAQAMAEIAGDGSRPGDLAGIRDAADARLKELLAEAGKQDQEIRVRSETDPREIVLFPDRVSSVPRPSPPARQKKPAVSSSGWLKGALAFLAGVIIGENIKEE